MLAAPSAFAGHRNRIEHKTFIGNAPEGGTFTETHGGKKRELVKQGPNTKPIVVEGSKTKEL